MLTSQEILYDILIQMVWQVCQRLQIHRVDHFHRLSHYRLAKMVSQISGYLYVAVVPAQEKQSGNRNSQYNHLVAVSQVQVGIRTGIGMLMTAKVGENVMMKMADPLIMTTSRSARRRDPMV